MSQCHRLHGIRSSRAGTYDSMYSPAIDPQSGEIQKKHQAPSSKLQAPEKHQASSSNQRSVGLPLELDVWNFSGAWSLGFGASKASLQLQLEIDSPRCLRHNCFVKNPTALSRRGFAKLLGAGAAYAALRPALGDRKSVV